MEDNKYIDLISTASLRDFPNNIASDFTNKLAQPLVLDGDWEVGLAQISHPKIDSKLIHKGSVWIDGDLSDSLKSEFEIDFSKTEPFSELINTTKRVVKKLSTGNYRKPELKQDGNGAFSLINGAAEKDGDYKLVSHFKILPENFKYLGFSDGLGKQILSLEQDADKKMKSKSSYKNDRNPLIPSQQVTLKNAFWVKDKIQKKEISIIIDQNDTLSSIASKLNAEIDKQWKTLQLGEDKYPMPKFSMDKNNLVYSPGLMKDKKSVAARISYDRKTLDFMGFVGQKIEGTSGSIIRAEYLPNSGISSLIFFYTDIAEEHHVGDSMANSLRGIPAQDVKNHRVFNPIIYHPVRVKRINKITVFIADEIGGSPNFSDGKLHATLHLRRIF